MAHKDPAPHGGHGGHGASARADCARPGHDAHAHPDLEAVQVGRAHPHADHRRRGVGLLHPVVRRVASCSCRAC